MYSDDSMVINIQLLTAVSIGTGNRMYSDDSMVINIQLWSSVSIGTRQSNVLR